MSGVILPVMDPFWSTHRPPNGYNCRRSVIQLTAAEAQRRGVTVIPPNASPDPGFDFNPWADAMTGIERGVAKFIDKPNPALAHGLRLLGEGPNARPRLDPAVRLAAVRPVGVDPDDFGDSPSSITF